VSSKTSDTKTEQAQPTVDELEVVTMPDGNPLYIATDAKIVEQIVESGVSIFYVLGKRSRKITDTTKNTTSTKVEAALFKVVSTILGTAKFPVTTTTMLAEIPHTAEYSLPPLPMTLVRKVEKFLRMIGKEHGTEAVVLLTYDVNSDDSSGWGVAVPEQENTAIACDYTPESVATELDDDLVIAGSIHSHPGMSAYASGTDHKDQANFDGLHVTIGWKGDNPAATEYYIEYQIDGQRFVFTPDEVFEMAQLPEADAEIESWTDKVSKKTATTFTSTSHGGGYAGGYGGATGSTSKRGYTSPPAIGRSSSMAGSPVPKGAPDNLAIYVGKLAQAKGKAECPFCNVPLSENEYARRRCSRYDCSGYFMAPGEDFDQFLDSREKAGAASADFDVDKPVKDVYVWDPAGKGKDEFTKVLEKASSTKK
jgi:proteasome lid subunit RPN8/RPN11